MSLTKTMLCRIIVPFTLYWISSQCRHYPFHVFQGQCFVAINPENFAPGFSDRMSDLLSIHRGMEPVSPTAAMFIYRLTKGTNV